MFIRTRRFDGRGRHAEARVAKDRPQDHADLEQREGSAQATACAAPERDPLIGPGSCADEALRLESVGLGVEVRPAVQGVGEGHDDAAGLQHDVVERERLDHVADIEGGGRMHPKDLVDRRVNPFRIVALRRLGQTLEQLGLAGDLVTQPGQCLARRLITGDQQPRYLLAQCVVGDRIALVVADGELMPSTSSLRSFPVRRRSSISSCTSASVLRRALVIVS